MNPRSHQDRLKEFVASRPFFGKYKLKAHTLEDEDHVSEVGGILNNVMWAEKLESLASHYMVQYVKHACHPRFDTALCYILLNSEKPMEAHEHYLKEWKKHGDFTDGKLSDLKDIDEYAEEVRHNQNATSKGPPGFSGNFESF